MTGNQKVTGSIPVSDSEVFSSEKKKLVTTTITLSQCLSKLQDLRINHYCYHRIVVVTVITIIIFVKL